LNVYNASFSALCQLDINVCFKWCVGLKNGIKCTAYKPTMNRKLTPPLCLCIVILSLHFAGILVIMNLYMSSTYEFLYYQYTLFEKKMWFQDRLAVRNNPQDCEIRYK